MADQQLEALTTLASPLASGDQFLVNDVSDTTDDVGGSVRKVLFKTLGHDLSICTGRLTGTSGTYITSADVTNITTLYFCGPQGGNFRTWLYDGTVWNHFSYAQISKGLGTLTANLPYDVFLYDNSGTPDLEFLAWTSGGAGTSARATALATQDGVVVKSGDATRRYVGTFHTTSTTQTQDTNRQRLVWNFYNQTPKNIYVADVTSHTYTTAEVRQWRATATNQIDVVLGVTQAIYADFCAGFTASPATYIGYLIQGVNSTSSPYRGHSYVNSVGSYATDYRGSQGLTSMLAVGYNYIAALQYGATNVTFQEFKIEGLWLC